MKLRRYAGFSTNGSTFGWRCWFCKTEVAMRAAFKAVNDHKQVVVLGTYYSFGSATL